MSDQDTRFMRLALSLGRRGQGQVWPWPSVGCVIVKDGRIVGRGRSNKETVQHAEAMALAQAGSLAKGATVYVTLEPCAHHGRTPPCCDALVKADVARVVASLKDPNPQVNGQGFAWLSSAGIKVDVGLLKDEAEADLSGFLKLQTEGRPHLTLKLALTADGRIATANGDSQWITGEEARHHVHGLRHRHDAIMVGAGTVRADNPALTVRGFGKVDQAAAIVVSENADLPRHSAVLTKDVGRRVWICHSKAAHVDPFDRSFLELLACEARDNQIDLRDALARIGQKGVTRILCEGGGKLAASLLKQGLVDELVVYSGGKIIGAEGRPGIGALGLDALSEAPEMTLTQSRVLGGDVMHHYRLG